MNDELTLKEGIKDGSPIFLGYFTTSLAFVLLTRTSGLRFIEGLLISLTNYSGSGQFLMMNLYNGGAFLLEIVLSVLFINIRYMFMSTSLLGRLENQDSLALKIYEWSGIHFIHRMGLRHSFRLHSWNIPACSASESISDHSICYVCISSRW